MIDYEKYDPAKDADESDGHLCNSLNAMNGMYRKRSRHVGDEFDRLSDYIERAEATIWYLRKLVEKGEQMAKPKYDIGEQVLIKGTVKSYRGDEDDIVYDIAVRLGEYSTVCFEFNEKAIFAGFVDSAEEDDLK